MKSVGRKLIPRFRYSPAAEFIVFPSLNSLLIHSQFSSMPPKRSNPFASMPMPALESAAVSKPVISSHLLNSPPLNRNPVNSTSNSVNSSPSTPSKYLKLSEFAFVPKSKPRHVTVKLEFEDSEPAIVKPSKSDSKHVKPSTGEPADWRTVYDLIVEMREGLSAPVDSMGCERLASAAANPRDQRFQTLIALMLSSQTKDQVTSEAVRNLQHHWPSGLTIENILSVSESTLNSLIAKVGFHNRKAEYIKKTAEILKSQYNSDIPDTIDGLLSLPGVGPKMGYLCLQSAWKQNVGIGVDVHVHRISNRLGWVKSKEPEETRKALQDWLPQPLWPVVNGLLVGFGQQICLPINPKCSQCRVNHLCVEGRKNIWRGVKKEKIKTETNKPMKSEINDKKRKAINELSLVEGKEEDDGEEEELKPKKSYLKKE